MNDCAERGEAHCSDQWSIGLSCHHSICPSRVFRGGRRENKVGASWFYNVPDLNIASARLGHEAYWSFREALRRPTPASFFEDRSIHTRSGEITEDSPGGKAQITRSGDRLTIIAAGRTAALAEDAADEWAKLGGRDAVEVVSLGFIKPLDKDTILKSASKTGRVLIVQDEPPWSGYAPYVRCARPIQAGSGAATHHSRPGPVPSLWDE
jgi:pyruvate/2-oxoglutarate/acetoin dehydrogenase E1 component